MKKTVSWRLRNENDSNPTWYLIELDLGTKGTSIHQGHRLAERLANHRNPKVDDLTVNGKLLWRQDET